MSKRYTVKLLHNYYLLSMESYIRYSIMIFNLYIIIVVSTTNARKLNKSYSQTSADSEVFKTSKDGMVI